jgi:hypothetical protein
MSNVRDGRAFPDLTRMQLGRVRECPDKAWAQPTLALVLLKQFVTSTQRIATAVIGELHGDALGPVSIQTTST